MHDQWAGSSADAHAKPVSITFGVAIREPIAIGITIGVTKPITVANDISVTEPVTVVNSTANDATTEPDAFAKPHWPTCVWLSTAACCVWLPERC